MPTLTIEPPPVNRLHLLKIVLPASGSCDGCDCPLVAGELAWKHEPTNAVGCCQPCCRDAVARQAVPR